MLGRKPPTHTADPPPNWLTPLDTGVPQGGPLQRQVHDSMRPSRLRRAQPKHFRVKPRTEPFWTATVCSHPWVCTPVYSTHPVSHLRMLIMHFRTQLMSVETVKCETEHHLQCNLFLHHKTEACNLRFLPRDP